MTPKYKKPGRPKMSTTKLNRIKKDIEKECSRGTHIYPCSQKIFARYHKTSLRTINKLFQEEMKKDRRKG